MVQLNQREDHPRSCGKDLISAALTSAGRGSPPLVRERPRHGQQRERCAGITPARAGKTVAEDVTDIINEDHPRSCGKDRVNRK